jgi:hypothetical protein
MLLSDVTASLKSSVRNIIITSTNKIKPDRQNKSPAISITKARNSNPTKIDICYQRTNTQEETITFIKPNQIKYERYIPSNQCLPSFNIPQTSSFEKLIYLKSYF